MISLQQRQSHTASGSPNPPPMMTTRMFLLRDAPMVALVSKCVRIGECVPVAGFQKRAEGVNGFY